MKMYSYRKFQVYAQSLLIRQWIGIIQLLQSRVGQMCIMREGNYWEGVARTVSDLTQM